MRLPALTIFIVALWTSPLPQQTLQAGTRFSTTSTRSTKSVFRLFQGVGGQKNSDPDKARLITSDIDNFWRAYDLAAKETDITRKKEIYQREYLDKGSPGLQDFISLRIKSAEVLAQVIEKHPLYYASIRRQTLKISSLSEVIRKSFRKLKALYPEAVFPDVYFVIGRLSTGGTTSKSGLLIGAEMYGMTGDTPTSELNDWLKQVLKSTDTLPDIVAHESVHFQQKYPSSANTLLAKSIEEGAADFIGERMAGGIINQHLHDYGNPRARQLWEEFKPAMHGQILTGWLYDGGNSKDRPADLGYYIGYKICESYYQKTRDKGQAIKDILQIKDFDQFLKTSGYAENFIDK